MPSVVPPPNTSGMPALSNMPSMPTTPGTPGMTNPGMSMPAPGMSMPALTDGASASTGPSEWKSDWSKEPLPVACWYFMNGMCTKGDQCKFSHDAVLVAQACLAEESSGGQKRKFEESAGSSSQKRRACWYFMRGLCNKGERCAFSHDPDIVAEAQNDVSASNDFIGFKKEMCRFFVTKGKCKFGEFCNNAHSRQELRGPGAASDAWKMPEPPAAVHGPPQLSILNQPGLSFLDRLEAGLAGPGSRQPAQGATSTAAALLGGGYGATLAQPAAVQTNPLQLQQLLLGQASVLQQQQLVGLQAAQPAGLAGLTPGVANPADAATQQYQAQLQQYLASMQMMQLLQAAAMQPQPQQPQ